MKQKKQQKTFFLLALLLCMFITSCGNKSAEFKITEELEQQEREEVNAMLGGHVASDGSTVYILSAELIYRLDMVSKKITVNCGNVFCDHEGSPCSARLSNGDYNYELRRNGDHVYVLGDKLYEISENSKKEIGHGGYGHYGPKIIFGGYIAFFETEDAVVVEEIESGQEIQRFENIRGYVQGSFYYEGCLYYVTDIKQLVRLNLNTGKKEVLEKKGATRASVYDGFIYYIRVSEEADTNYLVKLNPETLEKQELIEGVFYYNMIEDTLYYLSYPERELHRSDLNGKNRERLFPEMEYEWSWMWMFPWTKTALTDEDFYTYYLFNTESEEINFDEPIIISE